MIMQVLALDLLSPNLHHLLCVLTDQALALGDTRTYLELWVEREMNHVKRKTKFRGTTDPEKVAVNEIGLHLGLERLKHGAPEPPLELNDLINTTNQSQPTLYANPDDGPRADSGTFLLGSGVSWSERKHGMSMSNLLDKVTHNLVNANPDDCHGWTEQMLTTSQVAVYVHDRALLDDSQVLTARTYRNEKSRDSCHISTSYVNENDGNTREHIAIVKSFVRIVHVNDAQMVPLRFALVDFYVYQSPVDDADFGLVHRVDIRQMDMNESMFPVMFGAINHKLIYCTSGHTRYLVKYNIASGLY